MPNTGVVKVGEVKVLLVRVCVDPNCTISVFVIEAIFVDVEEFPTNAPVKLVEVRFASPGLYVRDPYTSIPTVPAADAKVTIYSDPVPPLRVVTTLLAAGAVNPATKS